MPRERTALWLLALLLPAACGDGVEPQSTRKAQPPALVVEEEDPLPPEAALREIERHAMVRDQIEGRDVRDPHVLAAMRRVPRHLFVPPELSHRAYDDRPLPIGLDQTISQPYIVASMTEAARVRPDSKVLEIGTGSGYQAAVLAAITGDVFSLEIKEPLVRRAASSLAAAGFDRVNNRHGDGYYGWEEEAPFDAILVTAAAPHIPPPLVKQLAPGGRMVIPVGPAMAVQDLVLVTKDEGGKVRTKSLYPVRFVPLTGAGTDK